MQKRTIDILSFGTVYLDIDFLNFPFESGIYAHRETVGSSYTLEAGGSSFNFAKISASLDLKTLFVGKIGKDPVGLALKHIAEKSKVQTHFIESTEVQTNLAIHYVHDDGTSIMTSGGSANQNLSPDDLRNILDEQLPSVRYLYLGGGLKLLKLLPFYQELIKKAKQYNVKTVLDHGRVTNLVKQNHKDIIKSVVSDIDIYLPSKDEFLDLWLFSSIEEGLMELSSRTQGNIVIKDSNNGAYSIKDGQLINISSEPVIPVNTIGAGDAFNAGYIKADSLGTYSLAGKIKFACRSAAIKISTNELPTVQKIASLRGHASH